jgi:hypothetical protein
MKPVGLDRRPLGRPPRRILAFVLVALAALLLALPATAQSRHRVILLEPADEPVSAELRARLRGELVAAGFEVVIVPSTGQDPKAQTESVAGVEHPAAVFYAVPPPPNDPEASGELWISDRLLRRTFVLRFGAAGTTPDVARVAVQAVEILKADLAELSVTGGPPHEPPPKPLPPPPPVKTREIRPLRVALEAGGALLPGFSGLGSTWTPVLRAGVSLPAEWEDAEPPHLDIRARVAALGGEARVEASEGEARVKQTLAGLELGLRLLPRSVVQPFFLVCVDAYGVNVAGKSTLAKAHQTQTWSLATGGGLGLWIQPFVHARARPDFALSLSAELEVAWIPTAIRIAERRVATAGSPTALVGAGLVGFF